MTRRFLFQCHWLLGITAGIVLAVVGVTGAMLSFENTWLRWLNPGVMTVRPVPAATPLPPAELVASALQAMPQRRVISVTLSSDPADAAQVRLSVPGAQGAAARRGVAFYLDPYTGAVLGRARGEAFFLNVMRIHRWLAADAVGKQIVGASTVALVILCLSGLYLRWPRRARDWRAWLTIPRSRQGRGFLWDLHAVAGTVALLCYLLAGLTGLYWSYDAYRAMLFKLAGVPQPIAAEARGTASRARQPQRMPGAARTFDAQDALARAWPAFLQEAPGYTKAMLRLPERGGQPVMISYLDGAAAHARAFSRLVVDARGDVVRHERYADKSAGGQFMGSIFALHSGEFFGVPGTLLMMLASLGMPLFTITGWMLYLDRRRKKRQNRQWRSDAAVPAWGSSAPSVSQEAPVLIGFASQSGVAEGLAWQTAGWLRKAGVHAIIQPLGKLGREHVERCRRALFIVSSFGEGEPPDSARAFARDWMRRTTPMPGWPAQLDFALLSLGDSGYSKFCGFGREFDAWLRGQGGVPAFEPIEVDRGDATALGRWRHRLADWFGIHVEERLAVPDAAPWRLVERHVLNPGGQGDPTYRLVFEPIAGPLSDDAWAAGDTVEIRPAHRSDVLRQYSIATVPAEGRLALLVRQVRHAGGLGIGSGWLTDTVPLGTTIALRVRTNTAFRMVDEDRPVILIGNGTGMAGLRVHLKARILAGRHRNWLVFGERNAAHDAYHGDEIHAWHTAGCIERLDWVFSRDLPERRYVQHRLRECADVVRAWVDDGAAIYVCGSMDGMAPGVDAALSDILGADRLDALAAAHRYCRDVY